MFLVFAVDAPMLTSSLHVLRIAFPGVVELKYYQTAFLDLGPSICNKGLKKTEKMLKVGPRADICSTYFS